MGKPKKVVKRSNIMNRRKHGNKTKTKPKKKPTKLLKGGGDYDDIRTFLKTNPKGMFKPELITQFINFMDAVVCPDGQTYTPCPAANLIDSALISMINEKIKNISTLETKIKQRKDLAKGMIKKTPGTYVFKSDIMEKTIKDENSEHVSLFHFIKNITTLLNSVFVDDMNKDHKSPSIILTTEEHEELKQKIEDKLDKIYKTIYFHFERLGAIPEQIMTDVANGAKAIANEEGLAKKRLEADLYEKISSGAGVIMILLSEKGVKNADGIFEHLIDDGDLDSLIDMNAVQIAVIKHTLANEIVKAHVHGSQAAAKFKAGKPVTSHRGLFGKFFKGNFSRRKGSVKKGGSRRRRTKKQAKKSSKKSAKKRPAKRPSKKPRRGPGKK